MALRKKKRKSAPVGVISKVLRILELLDHSPNGLQLKDIADQSGINKSTALRFLSHLEQENYLLRDENGAFLLGPKLVRLGGNKGFETTLCKIARPIMENLRKVTHETVNLAVLDGGNVLYLHVLESPHRFSVVSQVGGLGEWYCTALGKAILAHIDEGPEREEVLSSIRFVAKTPRTLMSVTQLREDLAKTRRQGFAHDDEEAFVGARCIGAAIFGAEGNVVGAISLSGPISRLTREQLPASGELVRQSALEISATLGYRLPKPVEKVRKIARKSAR